MGNLQVRFLEGWAPAMAPGYSTLTGLCQGCPLSDRNDEKLVATRQDLFLTTFFRATFDAWHCGQRCGCRKSMQVTRAVALS